MEENFGGLMEREVAVIRRLREVGIFTDKTVFDLSISRVKEPVRIDLSATSSLFVLDALLQQVYTAGHSRGYDIRQDEIKKFFKELMA